MFDLRQFLRDGVRLVRAQAEATGVTLHLPTPPAIALKGDERRLRQCVVNLLANAIKFAPGGEVTISAAMTGPGELEIRVADTGYGTPVDQLQRVFEPFHQVENELSRATNGTGLGLPLSRNGATLALESMLGRGTTSGKALRRPHNSLNSWNDCAICQFELLCYNTAISLRIGPCISFIPSRPR